MNAKILQSMRNAISKGDLDAAKQLSEEHPGLVTHLTKSKRNWMHLAAEKGQPEIIRWLAQEKLDCNARDEQNYPPLWYAVAMGASPDAVKALLESGADAKPRSGEANLLFEVITQPGVQNLPVSEALVMANLLIDHGCPVDEADNWGRTPLSDAVLYGFRSLAFMLLDRGANPYSDVNTKNLEESKEGGRGEIVQDVLAYAQSMKARDVIVESDKVLDVRPLK